MFCNHICLRVTFYDHSAWVDCWFPVSIRRIINKFSNVCPFDYTDLAVSSYSNWPSYVGLQSVCYRNFCSVFVLSLDFHFYGMGTFVINAMMLDHFDLIFASSCMCNRAKKWQSSMKAREVHVKIETGSMTPTLKQ